MTITFDRLLLILALILGLALAYGWHRLSADSSDFESQASAICQEELPAITSASTFDAALARSREMRLRLSALTPPSDKQATFAHWMAQLKGTEDAAIRGDLGAVRTYDHLAQQDVRSLGLEDACIHRLS